MAIMDRIALEKLKLPELKARCKEFEVKGYSKLNKPGLVDKLLASPSFVASYSSLSSAAAPTAAIATAAVQSAFPSTGSSTAPLQPSPRKDALLSQTADKSDIIRWPEETEAGASGPKVDLMDASTSRRRAAHTPVPGPSNAAGQRATTAHSSLPIFAPASSAAPPASGAPPKATHKEAKAKAQALAARKTPTPGPSHPTAVSLSPPAPLTAPLAPIAPTSLATPATVWSAPLAPFAGPKKRSADESARPVARPSSKKQATCSSKAVDSPTASVVRKTFKPLAVAHTSAAAPSSAKRPAAPSPLIDVPAPPSLGPPTSARRPAKAKTSFRPPVPNSALVQSRSAAPMAPPAVPVTSEGLQPQSLSFLPDVDNDAVSVKSITLPPPLRARARVHTLALLLSALEKPERDAVARSGKAGRYAVFLSAYHRLQRDFAGARLLAFLSRPAVDPSTSNLWPYLLARMHEAASRLAAVQSSWLGHLWATHQLGVPTAKHAFDAISKRMYGSPEDPRQLAVALRFVLARLHTALAVASEAKDLQHGGLGRVVEVRSIAEGVWRVDLQRQATKGEKEGSASHESLLVLEETGEPLGQVVDRLIPAGWLAPPSDMALLSTLRPDWRSYVAAQLTADASAVSTARNSSLLSLVQTPNPDEFPTGIHTYWWHGSSGQRGTSVEGQIARRYVLTSSVLQSTSGTYKTAEQMSDNFEGVAGPSASSTTAGKPTVNFFLPSRHHVLSVHLSLPSYFSGRPTPLHPSLAAVYVEEAQEPEFVLRETGQVVGGGPDGLSEVWQELIGCDANGIAL